MKFQNNYNNPLTILKIQFLIKWNFIEQYLLYAPVVIVQWRTVHMDTRVGGKCPPPQVGHWGEER